MAVSRSLRFQILRRDNHTCRYCGASAPDVKLTVDHVVPEALGGGNDPSNLVTACDPCNGGKSATPPDAAHVAQVADDAVRWAEAMRLAAEQALADQAAREERHQEFETVWMSWGRGPERRQKIPLPSDWPSTVDQLIGAGLPIPLLLECIDIAMGAKQVTDGNRFRYMCGVAWKKVAKIQDSARAFVGMSPQSADGAERSKLIAEILAQLGEEVSARATADMRDDDPGDEPPWWEDMGLSIEEAHAFHAVALVDMELSAWVIIGKRFGAEMPDWLLEAALREARDDFHKAEIEPSYDGELIRHVVRHCGHILARCEIVRPTDL